MLAAFMKNMGTPFKHAKSSDCRRRADKFFSNRFGIKHLCTAIQWALENELPAAHLQWFSATRNYCPLLRIFSESAATLTWSGVHSAPFHAVSVKRCGWRSDRSLETPLVDGYKSPQPFVCIAFPGLGSLVWDHSTATGY